MKILLDTHMIIWALTDNPKLSAKAKEIILNRENEIFYSVLSLWEIEIKHLAKPNAIPVTAHQISKFCKEAGFKTVALSENSIFKLSELQRKPDEPPHKDPFDRMLICQAITENMFLLTHDAMIAGYTSENIIKA